MGRRMLILGALIAAAALCGCNRPEGGWRNRNQDQPEPTQSGPVMLPTIATNTADEGEELLDQLEGLLDDLDGSLGSESDWQLDVPQENEMEGEDEVNAASVEELLSQLDSSLGTLDSALASESGQQMDPP